MPSRVIAVVTPLSVALLLCGCGGHELDVAPVRGTVTCEGQPLTAGTISFSPINEEAENPGKAAVGTVEQDGSFVLSTYDDFDGAIIGKHRVTYLPPTPGEGVEGDEEDSIIVQGLPLPKGHPCEHGGTSAAEVEVVSGENDLVIELSGTGVGGEEDSDSGEGE